MIINAGNLRQLYRSFKVLFLDAFNKAAPKWKKVAMEVPSTDKGNEYKWLGKLPRVREWIGDRVIQNLAEYDFTIKNKPWELTIGVDRDDIEDDQIGLYNPLMQNMAYEMAMHPDELVFELLANGFNQLCYDGQYFFDADHKDGNGPIQSNVTDAPLSPTSYGAARTAMQSLTDEHGKSLRVTPNLLVVPPQLEDKGREILEKQRLSSGEDNIYYKSAELLAAPELAAYPTRWFLLDTTKPIKPLIYQTRRKVEFVAKDNPDDENVFMRKEFIYGADARYNAGYGLWQLAYGSTGDGA
jgi:phage major head subunit gpT-like protein